MINMMRDKAENAMQTSPSRNGILKRSSFECNKVHDKYCEAVVLHNPLDVLRS